MMQDSDTPQWRSDLLQKIGAYGVSDPGLLEIAGAICRQQPLTEDQRRYALDFEARLDGDLGFADSRR